MSNFKTPHAPANWCWMIWSETQYGWLFEGGRRGRVHRIGPSQEREFTVADEITLEQYAENREAAFLSRVMQ